jgi:penicillin-binding protein 2
MSIFHKLFSRNKKYETFIHADEVFMDGQNIPGFNVNKMEGVIEKSISLKTFYGMKIVIILIVIIFISRLVFLQIISGSSYRQKAENNRLDATLIFAERGVIYDRNNTPLAWNTLSENLDQPFLDRAYIADPGFSHVVGYIGYPTKDKNGNLWRESIIGQVGIEKIFDTKLAGINGRKLYETDVHGEITTQNLGEPPVPGENITLSIDARIQSELYREISEQASRLGFVGGAGVIMDVHTGEIIAMTSYPQYDNSVLSKGSDREKIAVYKLSSQKPFINRAVSGLYTPGSTVKPFMGIAALQEGIITAQTTVYSSGKITVPNRYDPTKPQTFRDWKPEGHGVTNLSKAIAESVNTYFYAVGGGLGDQKGLGIDTIYQYMSMFKIADQVPFILSGSKQGTIPSRTWKQKKFKDGAWRLGDTYNTSIGQFGFQVGVLPMVRAVGALANGGTLRDPVLIKDARGEVSVIEKIRPEYFATVRSAMRDQVTTGTGKSMDVPFVQVAGKSGTAQVGPNRKYMNSWITGFFPYDKPQYAFVIILEQGPSTNQTGTSGIMGRLLYWMNTNTPEYFGKDKLVTEAEKNTGRKTLVPVTPNTASDELPTNIDTLDQFYENSNIVEPEAEPKKQKPILEMPVLLDEQNGVAIGDTPIIETVLPTTSPVQIINLN